MKHYKKRTIALCLASVLTVVGAFGAENYKNSLVGLNINNGTDGFVSLTAYTKQAPEKQSKLIKLDNNTYVYILPETNNEITAPDVSGFNNLEGIEILTLPYTNENEGETKIVIKTKNTPIVRANTTLSLVDNTLIKNNNNYSNQYAYNDDEYEEEEEEDTIETTENSAGKSDTQNQKIDFVPPDNMNEDASERAFEHAMVVISIIILVLIFSLIFIISRDKMASVVGAHGDFDIDDKKTKENKKNIRKTINKLDKKYTNKNNEPAINIVTGATQDYSDVPENEEKKEASVVVDLDMLYQEKTNKEQNTVPEISSNEENIDDLADFLTEFTFDEQVEEEKPFNEELYQEIINNNNLIFSSEDIEKINNLSQIEISEDLIQMLKEYIEKENNKPKPKTKEETLEDLLTTYSIQQNISFSKDDVDALQKLISVELDPDFVTNLHTNPNRVKTVENELKKTTVRPHKTSDILTLKVKDLLPDLSKELKKQGNKKIESNKKPDVIYFSEGYEVNKLSVSNDLSNISAQLNANNNNFKPSYSSPIVESGYEVSTLAIKDELPDLADVKANPDKYADKKEPPKPIDENSLLMSLSNVTFKPFYEEDTAVTDIETEYSEPVKINRINTNIIKRDKKEDNAQKLLKLIETQQAERAAKKQNIQDNNQFKKELENISKIEQKNKPEPEIIIVEGNNEILKTVEINPNTYCKLVKTQNEYIIYGYIKNKQFELKHFDSLNHTNLQIRTNGNQKTDKKQYLIKVDSHKFIVNVTEDSMEHVMDLC